MTSHFTGTTKNRRWSHGKQRLKRCVFRRLRKTGSEDADVTCGGRPFQMRAAAIGKARSPTVIFNEDMVGGLEKVTTDEERLLRGG